MAGLWRLVSDSVRLSVKDRPLGSDSNDATERETLRTPSTTCWLAFSRAGMDAHKTPLPAASPLADSARMAPGMLPGGVVTRLRLAGGARCVAGSTLNVSWPGCSA